MASSKASPAAFCRTGNGHAVHGQHCHIRGAAANVHHQVAVGAGDVQVRPQGGCQRLLQSSNTRRGAGLHGSIDHRPLLHFSNAAGHTDNDPGLLAPRGGTALRKKQGKHPLGHLIVGDHPVLQRPHGHHIPRRPAHHIPGGGADLQKSSRYSCPPLPRKAPAAPHLCLRHTPARWWYPNPRPISG